MKTITAILATGALLMFAPAAANSSAGHTTSYAITIPEDDHRIAIVSATLTPADEVFYMFPGAQQLPRRWANFVSEFEVRDENGEAVPFSTGADGTWHLSSIPEGPVTIRYRVNLDHEAHEWSGGVDGAAYARDWGVFYTGRSLFVVNGNEQSDISIDFHLPDQWQVTTPWRSTDDGTTGFSVPSHESLATSMIFAGLHEEVVIEHGPFRLLLALGGEQVTAQQDVFVDMARGVLDYYTELMGDGPRIMSQSGPSTSVVVINEYPTTDGEALGNNISILLEPDGGPMAQTIARMIFVHEFYHLWNGKSFAPSGLDGEWLKEGFSNYYSIKALHRIGHLNDEAYLGLLAGFFYQKYDSDPAVGTHALTEGELKHDHWGLIYSGGMLVAIAQDLMIRTATDNEKSLDDLMRYLFDEFNDANYEVADIEQALSRLNGQSQAEFFERFVHGGERIPVAEFLELADIETRQENGATVFVAREPSNDLVTAIQRGFFGD